MRSSAGARGRPLIFGLSVSVLLGAGCERCSDAGRANGDGRGLSAGPRLLVPRMRRAIAIDGELDELDWRSAGRTGPFLDPATSAAQRPYSEAKFVHDADKLYFALYAADEDIEQKVNERDGPVWLDDAFSIRLRRETGPTYQIDINAGGVVTDVSEQRPGAVNKEWESKVEVAVDRDGTPNDPSDDDEEWAIEGALPFASIGVDPERTATIFVRISRCDTPKGGARRCGVFGDAGKAGPPNGALELE
jgi:hypothetical protein